ncbi:SpaA isopeptide-forming pilin-related protein [Peptostreptococcus equinus]|uniref:SpaA isopeptide-forming pilin-related protein n=1 Tax=Peptostreptococcus equinus TaxID=3003601 RepID=A0ABY7JN13_9FIRM|nr:SpaA isopeptide-forming pilin-related protein [Peptostreptococcus sp. CBA3647]WAW14480.1 SpaA isopeptide-forming pilin-related protein [Peptostreptococcus sp. CBA3647]
MNKYAYYFEWGEKMKIKKKILNILMALAIAIPMVGAGSIGSSFAVGSINFKKVDSKQRGISGAEITCYKIENGVNTQYFKAKTDINGFIDTSTVTLLEKTDIFASYGKINLEPGDYKFIEKKAPEGYKLNTTEFVRKIVDNEAADPIVIQNDYESNKIAIEVKTVDKNSGYGIEGAQIQLISGKENVTTFITGKNGMLQMNGSTIDNQEIYNKLQPKVVNGVLLINMGTGDYTIKEKKAPSGYKLNTNQWTYGTVNNKMQDIIIEHEKTSSVSNENPKKIDTGFKLEVINEEYDPLKNVKVGVYKVDSKNKIIEKVFVGMTGDNGSFDSKKAQKGGELVSNGAISLEPGRYMYKADGLSKNYYIDVKEGQVPKKIIKLSQKDITYLNSKKNSDLINSKTNNNKNYTTANNNNKRLAKTGSENSIAYTLSGLTLLVSGAFIFIKK